MAKAKIAADLLPLAVNLADLWLWDSNYQQGDVGMVSESYREFRQLKPVVTYSKFSDERHAGHRVVIAGNTQLKAARAMNWDRLAAASADHLTESQAVAYAIADNRSSELALKDETALVEHLYEIAKHEHDLFLATGYDDDDLDKMMLRAAAAGWDPPPEIGPPPDFPDQTTNGARSKSVDVIHMCPHCGGEFKMYAGSGPQAI